jgi:hypothetical protein
MNCNKRLAVVSILFIMLPSLSIGTLKARGADRASDALAAAQPARQQCINACRARYRDCRRMIQLPSYECRGVYQDCTDTPVLACGRDDYVPLPTRVTMWHATSADK